VQDDVAVSQVADLENGGNKALHLVVVNEYFESKHGLVEKVIVCSDAELLLTVIIAELVVIEVLRVNNRIVTDACQVKNVFNYLLLSCHQIKTI
jgi:hypothetical protein